MIALSAQPTIYIAGASKDLPRAQAAMRAAVNIGFHILLDWTVAIEAEAAQGRRDVDLTLSDQRRYARADLQAAITADVFWLLGPTQSIGAWVEFGAALVAMRVRQGLYGEGAQLVVVSAPDNEPQQFSLFTSLADFRFDSDKAALNFLADVPKERALAIEQSKRTAKGFERGLLPPVQTD